MSLSINGRRDMAGKHSAKCGPHQRISFAIIDGCVIRCFWHAASAESIEDIARDATRRITAGYATMSTFCTQQRFCRRQQLAARHWLLCVAEALAKRSVVDVEFEQDHLSQIVGTNRFRNLFKHENHIWIYPSVYLVCCWYL